MNIVTSSLKQQNIKEANFSPQIQVKNQWWDKHQMEQAIVDNADSNLGHYWINWTPHWSISLIRKSGWNSHAVEWYLDTQL